MTAGHGATYDVRAVVDDSLREVAEARLKRFWADAVNKAGGTEALASRLAQLGAEGRDGPYHPKSIEAWRGGRRQPGADVLFLVASILDISLDHYVFGHVLEQPEAEMAAAIRALRERQGVLTGWLLEVGDKVGLDFAARVSQLDREERIGA